MLTITDKSLDYAIKKFHDFVQVNDARPTLEEKIEATVLLGESLGLSEETGNDLLEQLIHYFDEEAAYAFVGALIGVAMAEHAIENAEDQ